ncbi:hypothetical protein [Sphingomonas oryzagri]
MRAIDTPDLPLLDQHHGKPIALAHGIIAALCDLTLEQVEQLAIDDFIMLASDALWQVSRLSIDMGLSHDFFFRAQAEGEDA